MAGIRAVKSLAGEAPVDDQARPPTVATTGKAAAAPKKKAATTPKPGGGACGYYSGVSLFGGPSERRGCGQSMPPGNAASASPSVELPPGGSVKAIAASDGNGALAQYGPAVLFGGQSPEGSSASPPSGPITVSTKGTTSVTSSASVKNVAAGPFTASSVRSTCTASKSGVKALTTITRGVVVTATDAGGNTVTSTPVPASPPVNHTVKGTNSTGDAFRLVFNEQKKNRDGTVTVVAVHLYLIGPLAVGDVVVAESYCRA